ncbi:transcription factor FapR [Halobacillus sp. Nhm2S1]|uniref:transcription factor FapR n=1 Tax=Halobacillus sp. Nhm2S1 TaxID=2866716 RepID=UPI001C734D1D|nr:transcription factor FapR [Halobacillus sp. Nhm2S1]MBX0356482.1 transcription factor FapR [Halobacillus sp. Nhm2S1]
MKKSKKVRQEELKTKIDHTPFITDEELAKTFGVSIQTIRLDRMELGIPELRERIKSVATQEWNETVKALPVEEIIGEVVDLELDDRAISILDIRPEHVFSRNHIARGHYLFAQANSLAVALINDELALTAHSEITFTRPVKLGERVVAKATVKGEDEKGRTLVNVHSYVGNEEVFGGTFEMYRSNQQKEMDRE